MLRVFNIVKEDQKKDKPQLLTYTDISDFFNQKYAIDTEPFNPTHDIQYAYLRQLESKSVSSLVEKATQFPSSLVNVITQYSGNYFDPIQSQMRQAKLKSMPQIVITSVELCNYLSLNRFVIASPFSSLLVKLLYAFKIG